MDARYISRSKAQQTALILCPVWGTYFYELTCSDWKWFTHLQRSKTCQSVSDGKKRCWDVCWVWQLWVQVCVCVFVSCCPLLHAFPAGSSPPATSLPQPQYAHHAAEAGEIVSLLPLRHSESHQALLWATCKTSSRLQLSCSGLEHCFCSGTRWMCRSPQAQHLHYHHSSGKRLLYEEDLYMNHGNCSNKCCGNMQRKSA